MWSVPTFHRGRSELSWERDANGGIAYTLRGPTERAETLNPGMLVIALLADGVRDLGEIYDTVLDQGIAIDDPAHVVLVFRRLERTGTLAMAWHFESAGPVRHECVACGRSCEGQLIGPLSEGEVERLVRAKEALKSLEPDLPDLDPVVLLHGDAGPEPCLNTTPGRCVFFTGERLCAIHKHFGPREKPLICQLFPLRVIETEAGFRVGVSSRCSMAHRTFRDAPPQAAGEAVAALGLARPPGNIVGLDPTAQRSLRFTRHFERNLGQESYFLSLFASPGLTWSELVASSDGTLRRGERPPRPYLDSTARRLRGFADSYTLDPIVREGTEFGDAVAALVGALRGLEAPPEWVEPERIVVEYLVHALRQFVYLRETVSFGGVEIGVQVTLMGLLAALWTTPTLTEDDRVSDGLGQRIAVWLRIHNGGRARDGVFPRPEDYARHRATLSR